MRTRTTKARRSPPSGLRAAAPPHPARRATPPPTERSLSTLRARGKLRHLDSKCPFKSRIIALVCPSRHPNNSRQVTTSFSDLDHRCRHPKCRFPSSRLRNLQRPYSNRFDIKFLINVNIFDICQKSPPINYNNKSQSLYSLTLLTMDLEFSS